ncbi:MAG: DUF3048 domain-containing protein, partial [Chloroflexi bacterium]|nr:DUF3048 domain-containing protein [Chloroflexota bacterium]
ASCNTADVSAPDENPTVIEAATATLEPSASPIPPTVTPTKSPTATPTPEPSSNLDFLENYPAEGYGPIDFPADINPLTGLRVPDPAILDRRPISIKISNYPRGARPQWGLSLADHVFEYYHESGLTRFNAIFYGNHAEQVGPIRSARFSDEDIVQMYKAFFAYGSADYRILWRIAYSDFADRTASVSDYPCPPVVQYPLCRIEPDTWHHLVTNTDILNQYFDAQGISNGRQYLDGLFFNTPIPPDGQPGDSLVVRYSFGDYNKWVYDPTTGRYNRYHDMAPDEGGGEVFEQLTDRLNEQPIAADNVVVLLVRHEYYSYTPEMIEIQFNGFGKAYIFRDGQAYLINWARLADQDIIFLTYDDGSRFPLKPGNTWFQVVGISTEIVEESPGWRFQFFTP